MGIVYINHHIDTEGPLWENIQDLFERLNLIFEINLDPTYENLELLQKGQIDLPLNKKKELLKAVDPHTVNFKKNWGMIEDMLRKIMSSSYRNELQDSFGGGWVYNWHVMDHVGFSFENPRHRDLGFHNIFNFYNNIIKSTNSVQDKIHWHFHPIPFYKQANIPATSYDNSMSILHQIISRRLIDKNWFPTVNRAGFHSERFDSNFFLEQWLPFDPSNQSVSDDKQPKFQNDLSFGRFGDWRGAPDDWSIYSPSIDDWRKPGKFNRKIARVLNMKSRHRNISEKEIEKAFLKASKGEDIYLGITNHDWREMSIEIDDFRNKLKKVIKKYPKIKFKFSETIDSFRKVLKYDTKEVSENKITIASSFNSNILSINIVNGETFGPQPYLAIKTKSGDYFHDNFDFGNSNKQFNYTFDDYTIPLEKIESIRVASNDKYGNCHILKVLN